MACFRPIKAWKTETGVVIGGQGVNADSRPLQLPCGKCDGCRLESSRQWAVRCMHERQLHDVNSFVTLTYDDGHLPRDGSLRYRDWQLFAKRLRKRYGSFRFFMCGEYGDVNWRPHYHACLFGIGFSDRKLLSDGVNKLYTSEGLSDVWGLGHCSIGDVTFESAAYVARYTLKKVGSDVERLGTVDFSTGAIDVKRAEFCRMSLRPAIGFDWWSRFSGDVKRRGDVVCRGRSMRPPRYYDKLLEREDPVLLEKFKADRLSKVRFEDGTPARLAVQEVVCKAGLKLKRREL